MYIKYIYIDDFINSPPIKNIIVYIKCNPKVESFNTKGARNFEKKNSIIE